ncbi:MAG TPA: hypothetical protein VK971_01900 [Thiohalobacter sp.]|nr:hypothetical protein [Thiohalobacter sp.]
MISIITGYDAIEYAEQHGLTLGKYADPTEDAREGLTPDEAREIAAEDPSLIYLTGQRVEAGEGEDHDAGHIERIEGSVAHVAWDSGVKTPCPVIYLRLV